MRNNQQEIFDKTLEVDRLPNLKTPENLIP